MNRKRITLLPQFQCAREMVIFCSTPQALSCWNRYCTLIPRWLLSAWVEEGPSLSLPACQTQVAVLQLPTRWRQWAGWSAGLCPTRQNEAVLWFSHQVSVIGVYQQDEPSPLPGINETEQGGASEGWEALHSPQSPLHVSGTYWGAESPPPLCINKVPWVNHLLIPYLASEPRVGS